MGGGRSPGASSLGQFKKIKINKFYIICVIKTLPIDIFLKRIFSLRTTLEKKSKTRITWGFQIFLPTPPDSIRLFYKMYGFCQVEGNRKR